MEEDAETARLALCCVALSPHFQSCAVSEGVWLALGSSFLAGCDPSELRVLVPVPARPPPARGAGQGSAAPGRTWELSYRRAPVPIQTPAHKEQRERMGWLWLANPVRRCFGASPLGQRWGRGGELWFQLWDSGGADVKRLGKANL